MARKLFYTSTAHGLASYPGFQFVATSAGVSDRDRHAVEPYLTYHPPMLPRHPPSSADIARLPVSLSFGHTDSGPVLSLCRYAGEDYSGRPGNFVGQAILLSIKELGGCRPIEMWRASWWAAGLPAESPSTTLPPLGSLPPGEAVTPARVLNALREREGPALELLGLLTDATLAVLDRVRSRIFLVARDVDTVAAWIGILSYSLPYPMATLLSFTTYCGEPADAFHDIVGITPAIVARIGANDTLFDLDSLTPPTRISPPGRFSIFVGASWQSADLAAVDLLSHLVTSLAGSAGASRPTLEDREDAALVATLVSRPDPISEDPTACAATLNRCGKRLPASVWAVLGDRSLPFNLAARVCEAADRSAQPDVAAKIFMRCLSEAVGRPELRGLLPEPGTLSRSLDDQVGVVIEQALPASPNLDDLRGLAALARRYGATYDRSLLKVEAARCARSAAGDLATLLADGYADPVIVDGALDGLEVADESVRRAMLTPSACSRLLDREWTHWPSVGCTLLVIHARLHPDRRVELTRRLLGLADRWDARRIRAAEAAAEIWADASPDSTDCLAVLAPSPTGPTPTALTIMAELLTRAWASDDVSVPSAVKLAERVVIIAGPDQPRAPTGPPVADAALILSLRQLTSKHRATAFDAARTLAMNYRAASPWVAQKVANAVATVVLGTSPGRLAPLAAALNEVLVGQADPRAELALERLGRAKAGSRWKRPPSGGGDPSVGGSFTGR